MNVQYISDNNGKTAGVFIPISDWNKLKEKYKDIEQIEVPDWQVEEVRKRISDYEQNPEIGLDFEEAIKDIVKKL